jgi:hypothetical protein
MYVRRPIVLVQRERSTDCQNTVPGHNFDGPWPREDEGEHCTAINGADAATVQKRGPNLTPPYFFSQIEDSFRAL